MCPSRPKERPPHRQPQGMILRLLLAGAVVLPLHAQSGSFHNAPASAEKDKNPYAGQADAVVAGKRVYTRNCAVCHGGGGEGTGNVPPLANGKAQAAPAGAVFWYITRGDMDNGMPAWAALTEQQRWQVITYVQSLTGGGSDNAQAAAPKAEATGAKSNAPPPKAPFTDYRYQKPGASR